MPAALFRPQTPVNNEKKKKNNNIYLRTATEYKEVTMKMMEQQTADERENDQRAKSFISRANATRLSPRRYHKNRRDNAKGKPEASYQSRAGGS